MEVKNLRVELIHWWPELWPWLAAIATAMITGVAGLMLGHIVPDTEVLGTFTTPALMALTAVLLMAVASCLTSTGRPRYWRAGVVIWFVAVGLAAFSLGVSFQEYSEDVPAIMANLGMMYEYMQRAIDHRL